MSQMFNTKLYVRFKNQRDDDDLSSIYRIQEQKVSSCIANDLFVTTTGTFFRIIKNNINLINM